MKKFSRTVDPLKDAGQYLTMAGYDYRTGIYAPFDSGPDEEVGDKRFLMASGPFDLLPGQVERLAVACFAAPYGGSGQRWDQRPRDSLAHLARTAAAAQFVYDAGWVLAGPPAMPNVTLVPGDNQARIVWDDVAERRPDPYWERVASNPENPAWDPMYRRYDFQGYAVYRSDDAEHWRRLAGFDLDDGIAFRYPANGDSAQPDSLWLEATDTGLGHSFLDASARNGFQYYYYVAAYDWNYQTTAWDSLHRTPVAWDTLVFATGPRTDLVTIPRWDAADFGLPRVRVVTALGDTTNPALRCSASVVVPFAAVRETCEMRFFGPGWTGAGDRPGCRYVVTAGDSLLVDTARFDVDVGASGPTRARSPVVNGIELDFTVAMAPPRRAFDAVEVARGRYPAESLRTGAAPQQAWWAFRGSDYEVAWTNAGGYLTARVLDATHGGIEVPYAPFTTTGQGPRNADGWCFVDRSLRVPSETLDAGAAQTYVCGGYFQFRPGPTDTLGPLLARIEAGDTWRLTGHRAEGSAPFHNRYHVIAGRDSAAARPAGLNVKVVPNPFIVY
ncbi:hypothetical protein FJY71_09130, partial [candidate division WOR-3 bacterium]|nr:hypothetical protein [candidate division WOR-3 bacterium]